MRKLYFLSVTLLIASTIQAQNGKILRQQPYVVADTTVARFKNFIPGIDTIVNSVNFSGITYLSDGLKVNGYVAVPKRAGIYPCIIYNRGGNRDFGALNDASLLRFFGVVSSWGYIVIGSQYRGNMGGEGKEEFGGADVNDVLNLIPALNGIPGADTSRIGMYGWSRGGMMTYLALTKTARIKAAIVGSGMADAFMNIKKRPEMDTAVFAQLAPGYGQNKDAALRERSAIYWADKINKTTPLLVMHGTADWRVSPDEALEMANKLYKEKYPFRFLLFEGGQHSLIEHFDEVNRNARSFLNMYVKDKRRWPNMEPHGN